MTSTVNHPPDSPLLNHERIYEAEKYNTGGKPSDNLKNTINIHNPSIEVHLAPGDSELMIAEGGEAELVIGGAATKLRLQPIDGGSYPRAAP